jgi:protein involved in ribonucleotide reduction
MPIDEILINATRQKELKGIMRSMNEWHCAHILEDGATCVGMPVLVSIVGQFDVSGRANDVCNVLTRLSSEAKANGSVVVLC